jgi:hypothetical protein
MFGFQQAVLFLCLSLIYFTTCIDVEDIAWVLSEKWESHGDACLRVNKNPLNMDLVDIKWDFKLLNYVVFDYLNLTVSQNGTGLNGCCAPGLWCDETGCFTQGFADHFVNYGFLNNGLSNPVYTCSVDEASNSKGKITSAVLTDGTLALVGNTFPDEGSEVEAYIYGETCGSVEVCNCYQCSSDDGSSCPTGYLCLNYDPSLKDHTYCMMSCAGLGDKSCPCGQTCVHVAGTGSSAINVCLSSVPSAYPAKCQEHASALRCDATRVYQKSYADAAEASFNSFPSSAVFSGSYGAEYYTNNKNTGAEPFTTGLCLENSDCADGNICTIDHCHKPSRLCVYQDVPGCSSVLQTTREREAPYMYYSYYLQNRSLEAVQTSSTKYLLQKGTPSSVRSVDDFPLQRINLPFDFTLFGTLVKEVSISPDGVLAFPPVRTCDSDQVCYVVQLHTYIPTFLHT